VSQVIYPPVKHSECPPSSSPAPTVSVFCVRIHAENNSFHLSIIEGPIEGRRLTRLSNAFPKK
jgi:hypothetical protein